MPNIQSENSKVEKEIEKIDKEIESILDKYVQNMSAEIYKEINELFARVTQSSDYTSLTSKQKSLAAEKILQNEIQHTSKFKSEVETILKNIDKLPASRVHDSRLIELGNVSQDKTLKEVLQKRRAVMAPKEEK